MTSYLFCVILMYSFHEIKAQVLSQPKLMVDRPVIREADWVTLNCQTPASVSASQCEFHSQSKTIFRGSSCTKNLTGTELLATASRKLPTEIEVACFYIVMNGAIQSISPDSDTSTIIINNLLQPKLTVNPLEITETDSVTLNCEKPSSVYVDTCYFDFGKKHQSKRFSCLETLTGAELLSFTSQTQPAKVDIKCFYLMSHQSPVSDTSTVTIKLPQPELRATPQLLTERDNVTLTCAIPSSVSVAECHLYFMRTKVFRTFSCVETLTGAELLSMAQLQASSAVVQLACFYTVKKSDAQYQSERSRICNIQIQNSIVIPSRSTDVVEKMSTITQTTPTSSVTKGLTVIKPGSTSSSASSSVTPEVTSSPESGLTDSTTTQAVGSLTSSTLAKPESESKDTSFFKLNHSIWKWAVVVFGSGVAVGIILLGMALHCSRRRGVSRKYYQKRSRANFTGDLVNMKTVDGGGLFPLANNDTYSTITSVPAADCPPVNTEESHNENSDVYHMYSTIPEEPLVADWTASTYSTIQAN